MRKPVSSICTFTNSFSNSQANLPSTSPATFATSTPEPFRSSSTSGFRDENPPRRIFEGSVMAVFVGRDWRRFKRDAR